MRLAAIYSHKRCRYFPHCYDLSSTKGFVHGGGGGGKSPPGRDRVKHAKAKKKSNLRGLDKDGQNRLQLKLARMRKRIALHNAAEMRTKLEKKMGLASEEGRTLAFD